MAPPDGAAVSDDAMGLTQRELLMEMREDIKVLKTTVDAIAKDQALGVGMRGRGDITGKERKTGRGERHSPAITDLPITMRLRGAAGAVRVAAERMTRRPAARAADRGSPACWVTLGSRHRVRCNPELASYAGGCDARPTCIGRRDRAEPLARPTRALVGEV